jgi:uncharacterized membrane protein
MPLAISDLGSLLWGTVQLRPYVFVFLLAYLVTAARDLGLGQALGFLLWGFGVAFGAEYASTHVGIPFGLYHYTGNTAGIELYLANVPVFDPLSFVFLAYAALCLVRHSLGEDRGAGVVVPLAGLVMMLLDVVIDPLAVRGDRWFLGRIFYYPAGGVYFGVPLSNFAGWALVGWVILGGQAWVTRRERRRISPGHGPSPWPGVGLYCGVLGFSLAMTLWIGEWGLLAVGILVHVGVFLLLYGVGAALKSRRPRAAPSVSSGARGHHLDSGRSGRS